jgi:hypothetical protein
MEDRVFEYKAMRAICQNSHGHMRATTQTVQARNNQPIQPLLVFALQISHTKKGLISLVFTGCGTTTLAKMLQRGERPGSASPHILVCPAETQH